MQLENINVLLVEDNPADARLLREAIREFENSHIQLTHVETLARALQRLGSEQFQVFAINCTHLGCPVRWFSESGLFMCPCHGGVYYADGERASGPPPRGLYTYDHKIEDGMLLVQGGRLPTLAESV